jgi:hypothetical protein
MGCSLSNPDVGALGNGKFGYTCSAQGFADASNFDTQCAPGVFSAPNFVPGFIAVGATFSVTYKSNKSSTETDTVISSAPSIVALTGGHFETLRAGNVAMIGMHLDASDDFEYVKIAAIASIKVSLESTTTIAASPMSADNMVLGGKLNCTWTWSSSEPLVKITNTGRKASVIGPPNTTAMVTATCGAQSGSLLVHLTGAPADAGTDGSSDAASDAASEAGSSDGGTNG